jgi:hypothetical protein
MTRSWSAGLLSNLSPLEKTQEIGTLPLPCPLSSPSPLPSPAPPFPSIPSPPPHLPPFFPPLSVCPSGQHGQCA